MHHAVLNLRIRRQSSPPRATAVCPPASPTMRVSFRPPLVSPCHRVALVGTAIAAALISTFNYLYSVADGVEPWWLPPAVVLGVLCVLLPATAVLVYLYLLHKRKSAGSRLGGGLGHGA